jgi:phosphoribosylformylglycinamidine cyclo-ligase
MPSSEKEKYATPPGAGQNDSPEARARAYTAAGVNINTGYALVQQIREMVKSTRTPGVLSDIGGFGGLFMPELRGLKKPVLVASTDGVGTKLKLAFAWNMHAGVGIDLVAMSVNDVLVQGASPLFFLDYFACGRLDPAVAERVIAGVAEGCRQAGCALLGGETAEMPGMYADGEYDLAGFCVGLADADKLIDGSRIREGDSVIGLASTGIHSNGYSLVRKLLDKSGLDGEGFFPGLPGLSAREALLAPTRIYVPAVREILPRFDLKGMAHITGGGFFENIPRSLPPELAARIDFSAWPKSPLFEWLRSAGALSWPEMLQIFNCGIGFILVVPAEQAEDVLGALRENAQEAWIIGRIIPRGNKSEEQVQVIF